MDGSLNIVLNSIIAWSLYRIFVKVSGGRKFVSLALAAAYLLSRMSYYQIGQFYGLMESLGLWAAVGLLYGVYVYVNEKRASAYFWANGLYFLASFIHERYMVLLPVLLLGLVFGRWAGSGKKVAGNGASDPRGGRGPQRCRTEPLQGQPLRIPQDRPFRGPGTAGSQVRPLPARPAGFCWL